MNHNHFEKSYWVHYYETGPHQKLRIINLMNYFEEVALLQSEERKVGLDYYQRNNVVWMLHKWDISIFKSPVFRQQILVRTFPVSMSGFMGYRKFWIFDSGGDTLVSAKSAWIFVNSLNKRPIRVNKDMKFAYRNYDTDDKLELQDIQPPKKPEASREFYVRQTDIDINLHVNNVRYVDWALETLPPEMQHDYHLENVRINFRKEITYGQKIVSESEILDCPEGRKSLHRILDEEGREACILEFKWQPFGLA